MELDHLDQVACSGDTPSPFFMSSRAPATSPQSWELQDVDFLLPGTPGHRCALDIALCEPVTNDYPTYFVDEGISDKSMPNRTKLAPPTKLQVHAMACSDEDGCSGREGSAALKAETGVVSPTMVDKKILVTDNDLRLFSARASSLSNMRALRAEAKANGSLYSKHAKAKPAPNRSSLVGQPSAAVTSVQTKRYASCDIEALNHEARAFKRVKSSDQSLLCAPSFDPRWYYGKADGFHGMQPSLLNAANRAAAQDYNGSSIYRSIQSQVSARLSLQQKQKQKALLPPAYSPPTRKIGIYLPAERVERLRRFHDKRKHRVYHKRIKYDCRKRLANASPRIKGRFVKKTELLQAKEKTPASPESSSATSSAEDC